jgi:hypothetical protein
VRHCAGSIISKKAAEGLNTLVLDVKTGNGAFMETLDSAEQLAAMMVCENVISPSGPPDYIVQVNLGYKDTAGTSILVSL